jgi:hypothetical protein
MKDSLEKANTEQRVFRKPDAGRVIWAKRWEELAGCELCSKPPQKNNTAGWMYDELDSAASTPEPPPKHNDHRPVYESLVEAIHERARFGLEKHGTHLKPHNGRNAMTDALQESLDMNFYLMQKVVELEEQLESVKKVCREIGGE